MKKMLDYYTGDIFLGGQAQVVQFEGHLFRGAQGKPFGVSLTYHFQHSVLDPSYHAATVVFARNIEESLGRLNVYYGSRADVAPSVQSREFENADSQAYRSFREHFLRTLNEHTAILMCRSELGDLLDLRKNRNANPRRTCVR